MAEKKRILKEEIKTIQTDPVTDLVFKMFLGQNPSTLVSFNTQVEKATGGDINWAMANSYHGGAEVGEKNKTIVQALSVSLFETIEDCKSDNKAITAALQTKITENPELEPVYRHLGVIDNKGNYHSPQGKNLFGRGNGKLSGDVTTKIKSLLEFEGSGFQVLAQFRNALSIRANAEAIARQKNINYITALKAKDISGLSEVEVWAIGTNKIVQLLEKSQENDVDLNKVKEHIDTTSKVLFRFCADTYGLDDGEAEIFFKHIISEVKRLCPDTNNDLLKPLRQARTFSSPTNIENYVYDNPEDIEKYILNTDKRNLELETKRHEKIYKFMESVLGTTHKALSLDSKYVEKFNEMGKQMQLLEIATVGSAKATPVNVPTLVEKTIQLIQEGKLEDAYIKIKQQTDISPDEFSLVKQLFAEALREATFVHGGIKKQAGPVISDSRDLVDLTNRLKAIKPQNQL